MKTHYVLEWSQIQQAFHIQRLVASIQRNMERLAEIAHGDHDHWPDYAPVGIFATEAEAVAFSRRLREELDLSAAVPL